MNQWVKRQGSKDNWIRLPINGFDQTKVGLTKPSGKFHFKRPTTTTSKDGIMTYTLNDFDSQKMIISSWVGKGSWIDDKYVITGLTNRDNPFIELFPKEQEVWTDGINKRFELRPSTNFYKNRMILIKPRQIKITNTNTTSSNDAIVPFSPDSTRYSFMHQTRNDEIYIGAYKGIKKLNKNTNKFEYVYPSVNGSSHFMLQTKDGNIFVGTYENGLKKLNLQTNEFEDFY